MSLRRFSIAMLLVCGLCVWGFARSGEEPATHGVHETAEDADDNHDEAAARYRASQCRHWRQLAIGSTTTH
jgi:hypothetical protein